MSTTEAKSGTTLSDVEEMRERRETLEEKLANHVEREEELSSELAHLTADGEGEGERAAEIREERQEVRQEAGDLEAALEVMDTRIEEATEDAARGEAGTEIASLRKRVGGIAGQHEQDVKRARELADKLLTTVRRVETARSRQRHLRALAEGLADRFDLEAGEFTILPEGSCDLSRLRKQTASKLSKDVGGGRDPADGADLEPAVKVAWTAPAVEGDVYASEIMEMVEETAEFRHSDTRRTIERHHEAEKEREATEAAAAWLAQRVSRPVFITTLLDAFEDQSFPPTSRTANKLFTDAVVWAGLVRLRDAPKAGLRGTQYFLAPEGYDTDGESYWPGHKGE